MAKVTAPLLSFGAGGAIAKTQVYASWKGIPYVRRYVVPANTPSTEKDKTKNLFRTLTQLYKNMDTDALAPWSAFASGKPLTSRNALLKFNVSKSAMWGQTDWDAFIGSPSTKSAPTFTAFALASGSAGVLTSTVSAPPAPTGWTLSSAIYVVRVDDNPQTTTDYSIASHAVNSSPWELALSSLPTATYMVSAWLVWSIGGGLFAYSASKVDSQAVA